MTAGFDRRGILNASRVKRAIWGSKTAGFVCPQTLFLKKERRFARRPTPTLLEIRLGVLDRRIREPLVEPSRCLGIIEIGVEIAPIHSDNGDHHLTSGNDEESRGSSFRRSTDRRKVMNSPSTGLVGLANLF